MSNKIQARSREHGAKSIALKKSSRKHENAKTRKGKNLPPAAGKWKASLHFVPLGWVVYMYVLVVEDPLRGGPLILDFGLGIAELNGERK